MRKQRVFHAPLLIGLGDPLMKLLDTGVRVLRQREWEERERALYLALHGRSVGIRARGTLILPRLHGQTLAALLADRDVEESVRDHGIELAVVALAKLHRLGFTHGDAMAENVMVDLEAGVARWFDFETVHDQGRPTAWRRADDLRALLATCLLRTAPGKLAETLSRILDAYADEDVTRTVAEAFTPVRRRSLVFHLGQAGLSFRYFGEIARLLRERSADDKATPMQFSPRTTSAHSPEFDTR